MDENMANARNDERTRMASLDVPLLSGSLVRLEPLSEGHVPDLTAAVEEDRWGGQG